MLIIGSGSFFTDLLTGVLLDYQLEDIALYNDVNASYPEYIVKDILILKNEQEVINYFREVDNRFIIAIGNNEVRKIISRKYESLGGDNISFLSSKAIIGRYAKISQKGVIIMQQVVISNEAEVDEGTIIYLFCGIGHSSIIGKYNLLSAGIIMSQTTIGDFCEVGIGVNFVPGNSIGNYCKIGTASVITKSFEDNVSLMGSPAKVMRHEDKE